MRRYRRAATRRGWLIAVGIILIGTPATGDMTGWWRMTLGEASPTLVFVTQVGTDVSFDFARNTFAGDLVDGRLVLFGAMPSGGTCGGALFGAAVRDQDRRLYGALFDVGIGCVDPRFGGPLHGERCGCFDENDNAGDGCDASCRVEPCFACSGEPSVCVPVGDGGACDDRHDCTTGETCSAGACGGGTPVEPCVDVTGLWRWHFDYGPSFGMVDSDLRLEQRDGYVVAHNDSGPGNNGPIDLATGKLNLASNPRNVKDYVGGEFCIGGTTGQVSANGRRVDGAASAYAWAIRCGGADGVFTGRRCRNEECLLCAGDCDDDGQVEIGELVTSVNIALERAPIGQCEGVDADRSGSADVSELTMAVNRLLHGCP